MGIEMHFVNGHTIVTSNSARGRWKIPTQPGKARFFALLKDARKWAKDNPPTDGQLPSNSAIGCAEPGDPSSPVRPSEGR